MSENMHVIGTTIFAPRHFNSAMEMLADGRIDGAKFITHRFPLSQFKQGTMMAMEGKVTQTDHF